MKRVLYLYLSILPFMCCFGQYVFAQDAKVNEVLNWIIEKDHLKPLDYQTNIGCFYAMNEKDPLTITGIIDYTGNSISNNCLKDFMTETEVKLFHSKVEKLIQVKWKKTHYKLNTSFFYESDDWDNDATVHFLSLPVFLNNEQTRAIIGEAFSRGPAFGRDDLILCELKNGQWMELARVVTAND